jgi:SET domain-containing protein
LAPNIVAIAANEIYGNAMKSSLPRRHVFTRLASFQINGIGEFAIRNIRKGEELTLDYRTFMDINMPKSWR